MALVVLVVLVVMTAILAAFDNGRPFLRRLRRHARETKAEPLTALPPQLYTGPIEPGADDEADRDAQREEMRLAALLAAGELPAVWYRQRMAAIAAAEAARHPMVHPPEFP